MITIPCRAGPFVSIRFFCSHVLRLFWLRLMAASEVTFLASSWMWICVQKLFCRECRYWVLNKELGIEAVSVVFLRWLATCNYCNFSYMLFNVCLECQFQNWVRLLLLVLRSVPAKWLALVEIPKRNIRRAEYGGGIWWWVVVVSIWIQVFFILNSGIQMSSNCKSCIKVKHSNASSSQLRKM